MMNLKQLFEIQQRVTDMVGKKGAVELASYIQAEVVEFLDELDWKHIKKNNRHIESNMPYAITDILKYLIQLAIANGVKWSDLEEAFEKKSYFVERIIAMQQQIDNRPVVVVDLDGVIANHSECFVRYLNICHGIEPVNALYFGHGRLHSHSLNNYYKMHPEKYAELKHMFRESNWKTSGMKVHCGAKEAIDALSERFHVSIITSRPKNYAKLTCGTVKWLDDREIKYNSIYWGRDKLDIAFKEGLNVVAMFDNEASNLIEFDEAGVNTFHVDGQEFLPTVKNFLKCYA